MLEKQFKEWLLDLKPSHWVRLGQMYHNDFSDEGFESWLEKYYEFNKEIIKNDK